MGKVFFEDGIIAGVRIRHLDSHVDERGKVVELLRSDDEGFFQEFGQCYLCTARPGMVKGFHFHKLHIDYFTAIKGMLKLVLYDAREKGWNGCLDDSSTLGKLQVIAMGDEKLVTVLIPPYVVHGIQCIGNEEVYMINNPTRPFYNVPDPEVSDEHRIAWDDPMIPYDFKACPWK